MKRWVYWVYASTLILLGFERFYEKSVLLSGGSKINLIPAFVMLILAVALLNHQRKKAMFNPLFWQCCFWLCAGFTGLLLFAAIPFAVWLGQASYQYILLFAALILFTVPAQIVLFQYSYDDELWSAQLAR
ncbi:hypothetical protein NI389_19500 (plasmid) [Pseudoalteromonas xiamenensis]|uniref:hypothetical protein n=1 Tax=Pseudoalteromonas xiamenensis TaxID=882626 RepID=UPI0027E5652E|nr:hypothetical protein [Pseudoalteromonas xiamenensis]WMN61988.1 hypothetical protein NI389_19500 [Pseudoalteromonas xiamenensis]